MKNTLSPTAWVMLITLGLIIGRSLKIENQTNLPKAQFTKTQIKSSPATTSAYITGKKADTLQNQNPIPPSSTPIDRQTDLEDLVKKATGEQLYASLFNDKILTEQNLSVILPMMKARFSTRALGYDKDEAIARVGLLKALGQQFPYSKLTRSQKSEYVDFNYQIAINQRLSTPIQVESTRNLRTWMSSLPTNQRAHVQRNISPTILRLAAQSDREIASLATGLDLPHE